MRQFVHEKFSYFFEGNKPSLANQSLKLQVYGKFLFRGGVLDKLSELESLRKCYHQSMSGPIQYGPPPRCTRLARP